MSSEPEHAAAPTAYSVGAAFPHPHAADPGRGATRWGAAPAVTASAPDQTSPWSAPAGGQPGVGGLAAVEPASLRVWDFRDRTRPGRAAEPEPPGAA